MTTQPTRVVDAHVHLWAPARTEWYPYLAHPQADGAGDASKMFRRFDVETYRAETAQWNLFDKIRGHFIRHAFAHPDINEAGCDCVHGDVLPRKFARGNFR